MLGIVFRCLKPIAIALVASLLLSGYVLSSEKTDEKNDLESSYYEFAEWIDEKIASSLKNSMRMPQGEVNDRLERFISNANNDQSEKSVQAEWSLRAALLSASFAPDTVERIPDLVRDIDVTAIDAEAESGKDRPLIALVNESLWKLINAREFVRAENFAKENNVTMPEWFDGWRPSDKVVRSPTYLAFDASRGEVRPVMRSADLTQGSWLIVEVHPKCGPSKAAMSYLSSHPNALNNVPKDKILFVVTQTQGQELPSLLEWNENNFATPMVLSYRNKDWPDAVTFLQTPVFNVVREGKVVDKLVGWPGDEQANELRKRISKTFVD